MYKIYIWITSSGPCVCFRRGHIGHIFRYYDYRCVLFLYKLIKTGQPSYLQQRIRFATSARTGNLIIPRNESRHSSLSLFVHGSRLWNALPVEAKFATTIRNFRVCCGYFEMNS